MTGKRIRQIRLDVGLRQWELAELLGTTQSAIHKYERGVLPEPRRLVELSRIGDTSVEWVLTGRHAEDGSKIRTRLPKNILDTARRLEGIGGEERRALDEALNILETAIGAARGAHSRIAELVEGAGETEALIRQAKKIHTAIMRELTERAGQRLQGEPPADVAQSQ